MIKGRKKAKFISNIKITVIWNVTPFSFVNM